MKLREIQSTYLLLSIISLLGFLLISPLRAQHWERVGPYGPQTMTSVAYTSTAVVAVTDTGLFRSTDEGRTWSVVTLPVQTPASKITQVSQFNNVFYASALNSSFFRSTDHGITWALQSRISSNDEITHHTAAILQLGSALHVAWGERIYSTTNEGISWGTSNIPLPHVITHAVAVSNTIVVRTTEFELHRTTDLGKTWQKFAPQKNGSDAYPVSIASLNNDLYAITYEDAYVSSDVGKTWESSSLPVDGVDYSYPAFAHQGKLYVGIDSVLHYSEDRLKTWKKQSTLPTIRFINHIMAGPAGLLFSPNTGGAYATFDNGTSWSSLTKGFPTLPMKNLWSNDKVVLAGTGNLLLRSTDFGEAWVPSFHSSIQAKEDKGFNVFQVGDSLFATMSETKMIRSHNNGATWSVDAGKLPWFGVEAIAGTEKKWLASATLGFYREKYLFQSTDRGGYWESLIGASEQLAAFDTAVWGATLFGLFELGDNSLIPVLQTSGLPEGSVYSIARSGNTLYTGIDYLLYRSQNAGSSWQPLPFTFRGKIVKLITQGNNVAFVDSTATGDTIYFSSNEGDKIVKVHGDFSSNRVSSLAFHGNYLFAQTEDNGILRYNYTSLSAEHKNRSVVEQIRFYPNPAKDRTMFSLQASPGDEVHIELFNVLGASVLSHTIEAGAGGKLLTNLSVSHLQPGTYTCKVQSENAVYWDKITVVR